MEKFLIIDGNSIAFRAYYAMPYLTNPSGEPSGAVFGFANILIKLLTELKPNYVAVAFDHARETFRNKIFAEYKGTRKETPSDLILQFPKIKDMLTCMGIQVFESGGIEADDIIGTLSLKSGGTFNILLSGDRDLLQLVSDHTNVYLTKKGVTDILKVDLDVLREEFGLLPYQVIELKSLMGDASDNIPGVKGVGEKTAKDLISKYSCLENVYENLDEIKGKLREKLELSRSDAYMSKTLATIKRDCDIDFDISKCKFSLPFSNKAFEFFKNYGFSSIVKKTELFALQPTENSINVEKSVVSTTDELKEILQKIGDFFAINLKKCEFSIDFSKIYVLKDKIDLFGGGVNIEDFCAILKPIFEDEKIEKITCDSKFDIKFLSKLNINLTNYFDLSIAKYLCAPGAVKFADTQVNMYKKESEKLKAELSEKALDGVYKNIELPLTKVLDSMENEGFKIDEKVLKETNEKITQELEVLENEIYNLAGEKFNINSPKQVSFILFDKLAIQSYNNKKGSTNINILSELAVEHEIAQKIIDYRKLAKLKNTYLDVYMSILSTSGDIIHTVFSQTLTTTGRLSSSEPNLQNIPKRTDVGRQIRQIFVSKFEGGKIISADYNQIELRLLAHMSGE
ncbi:MAG: DNA polymerase I, partial [Clostridia bacterium]|nr:DNA polymerase I [Clostridia bacterium]